MKKTLALVLALMLAASAAWAEELPFAGLFNALFPKEEDMVSVSREEYERLKQYEHLDEVLQYVEAYYYKDDMVDHDLLMEYAIQGMLLALEDPYTFYYNAEDWKTMWEEDEGKYAGVGLQLQGDYTTDLVTVTRIFKDTPAQEAGVQRGDILTRVEDLTVTARTMQEAVNIMRGTVGEVVEIEVLRGGESVVFHVPRAEIQVNWIEHTMLDDGVGYIALYQFAGDCATEFSAALADLEAQGAKALILDLRDNGGGWVQDAMTLADTFLDEQLYFYGVDYAGERDEYYTKDGKDDIPLVILVNENSASSSEITSGGLQKAGRALIVGVQSFGKGIMQSVIPLDENDGMQITTEEYFLSDGTTVHKVGITPDVVVEMPEELKTKYFELGDMTDPQLATAWEEAVKLIP